jgi:hypothetical protein
MTAAVTNFPVQDYVEIGADRSPGQVTVVGFANVFAWDERQGYGNSGATLVPKGDHLARGSLIFKIWEESHVPVWYAFAGKWFAKPVVFTPGSGSSRAITIGHPQLNNPPLYLSEFVVEECSQLEQDEDGGWSCEVKLIQYRKPRPAPDPPKKAIAAAQEPQPTAQDAADRHIEELTAQLADEIAKTK